MQIAKVIAREQNAPTRMLRRPHVEQRTGLSRSTIYLYIKMGEFPKPYRLGMKTVGWLESEINEWIVARVEANQRKR